MNRFLNPQREHYAWIAGVMLWASWLISVFLGPGNLDLAGQVIGTDYLEFYAAGSTVRIGESARLYDIAYQSQLQRAIIGPQLRYYYGFITPPFLGWFFVPFSVLPYLWSFALWSVLSLIALRLSLHLLGVSNSRRASLWALTWFPIFATISFGQNSLLSLLLLSLTFTLWRKGKVFAAGLAVSLLLYKPQLLIGVALLWVLEKKRGLPALVGLSLGGCVLAALSFWQMPEASRAYATFARTILPSLPNWQEFPLWHLHTVWGFWRLLLPGSPVWADCLYAISATAGLTGFAYVWRRLEDRPVLRFTAAMCLTLWVTPHAMIYDWTLLLIPAVLLWKESPELKTQWRVLFAILWIASFVSGPLTVLQLRWFSFAIQISVPLLFFVIYRTYHHLLADGVKDSFAD